MSQSIFLVLGIVFLSLSFFSLIYQIFSASFLTLIGIIFLNLAFGWFNWYWLILFAGIALVSNLGGIVITFKASHKLDSNKKWYPVIFGILGAIFIPIPFLGALIGVFCGSFLALTFSTTQKPVFDKLALATEITFKSFLGLVLEITFVFLMLLIFVLLIIF